MNGLITSNGQKAWAKDQRGPPWTPLLSGRSPFLPTSTCTPSVWNKGGIIQKFLSPPTARKKASWNIRFLSPFKYWNYSTTVWVQEFVFLKDPKMILLYQRGHMHYKSITTYKTTDSFEAGSVHRMCWNWIRTLPMKYCLYTTKISPKDP